MNPQKSAPYFEPHEIMHIYRKRLALTQLQMALELNSSQMYISRLERGKQQPSDADIEVIERILRVRIWSKEGEPNDNGIQNNNHCLA